MNKEAKIIFSITGIVVICVLILMIVSPKQAAPATQTFTETQLVRDTSHMTGTTTAKVTIVEFGDYECPACGAAEPIIEQVLATYATSSDFNFVFRNFPLPQHPNALIAAEAAEAAGAQGKFWEMHNLLYANQDQWADSTTPTDVFMKYATTLGLDTTKFKKALDNQTYQDAISTDQNDGNVINVEWTPSIYINGVLQQQTPTFDQFKTQIDALLQK
jgi:protein-disulfide isomerase